MTQTDFSQFPAAMHHLVEQAIQGEERRLYSVRAYFKGEGVTQQVRKFSYEVIDIRITPCRSYGGSTLNMRLRNDTTGEMDDISLPVGIEEVLMGLESRFKPQDIELPQDSDITSKNKYLESFKGVKLEGVALRLTNKRKKQNWLFGVFID